MSLYMSVEAAGSMIVINLGNEHGDLWLFAFHIKLIALGKV